MDTLEQVAVHLSPTRMTVGYYRIEGDELKMIGQDAQGDEIVLQTCVLKPTDNAKAIAGVLTKEIRSRMVNPFWDDMSLPESGVA